MLINMIYPEQGKRMIFWRNKPLRQSELYAASLGAAYLLGAGFNERWPEQTEEAICELIGFALTGQLTKQMLDDRIPHIPFVKDNVIKIKTQTGLVTISWADRYDSTLATETEPGSDELVAVSLTSNQELKPLKKKTRRRK